MSDPQLKRIEHLMSMNHLSNEAKLKVVGLLMDDGNWCQFDNTMNITESSDGLICLETPTKKNHFRVIMADGKHTQQLHGTSMEILGEDKRIIHYDSGKWVKRIYYDYDVKKVFTYNYDQNEQESSTSEERLDEFPKPDKSDLEKFANEPECFKSWLKNRIIGAMKKNETYVTLKYYGASCDSYKAHIEWIQNFCELYGYKLSNPSRHDYGDIISWPTGDIPR